MLIIHECLRNNVNTIINKLLIRCKGEEKKTVERFSAFPFREDCTNIFWMMIGRDTYAIR